MAWITGFLRFLFLDVSLVDISDIFCVSVASPSSMLFLARGMARNMKAMELIIGPVWIPSTHLNGLLGSGFDLDTIGDGRQWWQGG